MYEKLFESIYNSINGIELPDEIKSYIDNLMDELGNYVKTDFEKREQEEKEHPKEMSEYHKNEKAKYDSGEPDYWYDDARKEGLSYEEFLEKHKKEMFQSDYEDALARALDPFKSYILKSMRNRGIDTKGKYYWE